MCRSFFEEIRLIIEGPELKDDLSKLDKYFDALLSETKAKGIYVFASHPPDDASFLVTRLWNKYLPNWREHQAQKEAMPIEVQKNFIEHFETRMNNAEAMHPSEAKDGDFQYVSMERTMTYVKGKWNRRSPEDK
ncbi:MAG: hypothetical protein JWN74_3077 [Acidobacteriaceae bacterium]|nr:hypothetical protein [Acidobacteriaceae bacterium]